MASPGPDTACRIGDWTFDPRAGELLRGAERRRLEDRAARTLALLARRRGEVVSAAEIVADVWGGRSLSPNSVAVIIGDLRRALDDDARRPRHIETLAKRGYRLLADDAAATARSAPRRPHAAAAALAALGLAGVVVAGGLFWGASEAGGAPAVLVRDLANATGDPAYDPLTRASSELVVSELTRTGGLRVHRQGRRRVDAAYEVAGKLTLWNGKPSVTLNAHEAGTDAVAWSYVAKGPADRLPQQIRAGAREFASFAASRKS